MRIEKISPIIVLNKRINNIPQDTKQTNREYSTLPAQISFEARVDKGLVRFYETNATRMPKTVKAYIENLSDKTSKTPLQAQAAAFIALSAATSIATIKDSFDEPLFEDLKDPSETKATRGILGIYRENKELLELCNQSILKNNENLTIWLLKKIFLEGKTIEEINKDFNNEINPEFKALYLQKETNEDPIKSSTLKALGIKMPEFEYQQSLRYTREGYSDIVGEKISSAQREFWDSMPIEERTARARRSVERFEKWWNSMSRDEQLDLIAQQIDELEMLKKFNSSDLGKVRSSKNNPQITEKQEQEKRPTGSSPKINSTLSRDELFKIWASNNLKMFKANLTEFDLKKIETKRQQQRADWWNSMTSEERTDYINRLRTGAEPLKFAMIDAWNKNPDILIELSHTLKTNHFNKLTEILYGTTEFDKFMSETMTRFWESHPDFAIRLGESIKESHDKIKEAINNGNFEFLKREIANSRNKREKDVIEAVKNYRVILTDEEYDAFPEHVKRFIDAYSNSPAADVKFLPVKYLKDYYNAIATEIPQEVVESWVKALKKEPLSLDDNLNLEKIRNLESLKTAVISRTLEATLADILYECTGSPDVYKLSHADCKWALKQVTSGNENIEIYSHKLEQKFKIPVKNRDIDVKKIDKLYDYYNQELPENALDSFIDQYIEINATSNEQQIDLIDYFQYYISMYKTSIAILFGNTQKHTPEIRAAFAQKFIENLPSDMSKNLYKLRVKDIPDFEKEKQIHKIANAMRKKYGFLPQDGLNLYLYELSKVLRSVPQYEVENFEKICARPKKSSDDVMEVVLLDRSHFSPVHMIYSLCLEQALADILYENCGNEEIYALNLEELLSCYESLMLIKKFPMKEEWAINCAGLGKSVLIKVKKRIQPYQIEHKFRDYYNEVTNYVQECIDEKKKLTRTDILYILNPDENKILTDKLTAERIKGSIHDNVILDNSDSL